MTTLADYYEMLLMYDWLGETDQFICGTEYEIESVQDVTIPGYIGLTEDVRWYGDIGAMADHSLRNNGIEFVTRPVSFDRALTLFKELRKQVHLGENPYSHRTSTHVHVNVASMTLEQLKHFVLLYAITEPVFFDFAGDKRKHNIHCVPLQHTIMPIHYKKETQVLVDGGTWSKYTAFNLLPVTKQGTVEFRHLGGTGDFGVYQAWLTKIKQLWQFAMNAPTNQLETYLNAGLNGCHVANQIFGGTHLPQEEFYQSTIDVKLAFV